MSEKEQITNALQAEATTALPAGNNTNALQAENVALQTQLDDLRKKYDDREKTYTAVFHGFRNLLPLFLFFLLVNFFVLSPEKRWLHPKLPEPFSGSRCLWYEDSRRDDICSVWAIYALKEGPAITGAGEFGANCFHAGRATVFKGTTMGPVKNSLLHAFRCSNSSLADSMIANATEDTAFVF